MKDDNLKSAGAELNCYFSSDYFRARKRFVAACKRLGFAHHSLPVDAPSPNVEPLSIDVGVAGAANPEATVLVSSGVHGVEGFFGSAVQLAFLDRLRIGWQPPDGTAVVFLHALNPFGFAWQRRFNEENVDLNRNFLLDGEAFAGAPPLCERFRRVLMPAAIRRFGFSQPRIAMLAMRHGVRSLWETLPVGQYDFPDWLYFGGRQSSQTAQLLERFLPTLLDTCREVVHLDFHTGLGRWANCELLLAEQDVPENVGWWKQHFGSNCVREADENAAYQVRGGFGSWLRARFPQCRYRFATAEFGTYSPLRVISALTHELGWHARLGTEHPHHWSRRRLTETFVPRSQAWRAKTVASGVSLIRRATDLLWSSAEAPCELLATG